MFYPIYVDEENAQIHSVGQALASGVSRSSQSSPEGTYAVWPVNQDGTEGRWRIGRDAAIKNLKDGFIRANVSKSGTTISYLAAGFASDVRSGKVPTLGRDDRGVIILGDLGVSDYIPGTAWNLTSHNSRDHGSTLVSRLIMGRSFPYPKSLYAVEDALRFFVKEKHDAVVLDFFSGSGTTAHAVMRLNKQDGGRRQCISVTNNEVGVDEQRDLVKKGLRPGDPEWEALGICDYITKPRVTAAITGKTPEGEPIKGDYRFTDEFPMADGFEANARFFTLTYESEEAVEYHYAFNRIAPMLWLRAGGVGRVIDSIHEDGWDTTETYAVVFDATREDDFLDVIDSLGCPSLVYIVTNSEFEFQRFARRLPENVEAVPLYRSYLTNFRISHSE